MGQILKLSRKIKVNRTRCQLWLHLSPSLLGPEKHSPHLWPILQAFLADYNSRPALKHSQARLLLPKSERNGPHPRDTFLEPSHTPCLLIPLLLVKIHHILLSTWACMALRSFKKHTGLLSLVLGILSSLFSSLSGVFLVLSVRTPWPQISGAMQLLMSENHCWLC